MSCSCKDTSCNCLERCCCPSEFCVCITCFNLRKVAEVKNEANKPFGPVSNASSDSQKSDVTNTDYHLKNQESIQISRSSCDELESDVVCIGSYNINRKGKKFRRPKVLSAEIVLSDGENKPVFTVGGEDDINREDKNCSSPRVHSPEIVLFDEYKPVFTVKEEYDNFKITHEIMNRGRFFKGNRFCQFSNKGIMFKRKRSLRNQKSDENSYQDFRRRANILTFHNRSHAPLEEHEDTAARANDDVQVIGDNIIENSSFNRYFSEASSSRSAFNAQNDEFILESPVSVIRNNSLKSETNRCINENNITENSHFHRYFSEASLSCSAYQSQENETMQESPISNIRSNSSKSETNKYTNVNNASENSNFNRYFSEASSSSSSHKSPVSNIRNNSPKSETNRCINENNVTENTNFNRYFSDSSSFSAFKSQENESMQESPISNTKNNSLKSKTNLFINESNVPENSNFNRYFSEGSSNWNACNNQENEIAQETPVASNRNYSLEQETNRHGLFTHKSCFDHKKQKSSCNNFRSALNGKEMFSGTATILQPDEGSSSPFDQQTNLSSNRATVMQTNKYSAAKSSTFHGNNRETFSDVCAHDSDIETAKHFSDQDSLIYLKSDKRHVQRNNSGGLTINVHPDVGLRGSSEDNSLPNINQGESSCKAASKNKHVSFLLPSCHSSSEICNDYQESYRNSLQNTDDGESGCNAAKNNKPVSFMNPSCHSSSEICNDYQANYAIRKKIRKSWRKRTKRRYKRERTSQNNEFTGESMSTRKLWRKGSWRRTSTLCKVEHAVAGNEMKKEKIYIKGRIKKENGFGKAEINYIKREIKKEEP